MRWTAAALGFASSLALSALAPAAEAPVARGSAESYLARWVEASRSSDVPDLDQYLDRYGDQYPETVLKYIAAFFGPVDRKGLEATFRWSVVEVRDSEIRLRATPRSNDGLAVMANSQSSSGDASPGVSLASGVEQNREMLAFEVVIDSQIPRPRLVSWLGPGEKTPREAVMRLLPVDGLGDEPATFRGAWLQSTEKDGVAQASATLTEAAGVDPEVLEILSRWEQATSELKSVELTFKRFDRDHVFEVETRGVGRFIFVAPNRGLYQLKSAPVVERAEGPSTASGGRMAVASAKPQLYWWNGENVTIVDERENSYDTLPIPKRMGENIQTVGSWDVIWQVLAGPQKALPAVVDLKAEKLLNRFEWTIEEKSNVQIHLEGTPRTTQDRRHIKRLSVMLDPKTYRTTATRLADPTGARETIHTFEYVRVNDESLTKLDSWKPDLAAMSPLGPPPLAPAVEELPGAPPPQ